MSERYATILTQDDNTEIVSNICQYEGKPPEPSSKNAKIVKIPDGVKIGMVKGGELEASGGYGFPAGSGLSNAAPKQQDKAAKSKKDAA